MVWGRKRTKETKKPPQRSDRAMVAYVERVKPETWGDVDVGGKLAVSPFVVGRRF